ncbi:MAG: hypothetical protein IKF90_09155 [Parasporobacterium sp.]|nr:hypothetical protein [Parasporobacterium sp.]
MADIQEYKCPNCGGTLTFDSTAQKMVCPYCDSEINVEALKDYDKGLDQFTKQDKINWETPGTVWQEGETEGMRVYVCKSCGGQIIGDENLGATKCPYCGNPVVLMGQFSGDLKPDMIIPFQLDKEAAKAAYLKHLQGKTLLPKMFKDQNHIDEIKGVYVPFWLFDGEGEGHAQFEGTKIRTWSDSRNSYTETSYFDLRRSGTIHFSNIPADASSSMPDELMESIEPFDASKAVDFQSAYLSGYLADRYDVGSDDNSARINERVKKSIVDALASTIVGYSSISLKNGSVNLNNAKVKYALFPIWLLSTTYQGTNYLFCMNGQTGKMVGDLPSDNGKVWKYRILWTVIIAAVLFGVWFLVFR